MPEIRAEELAALIGEVTLIDVRQPDEYVAGHVPSARLIPLHEVPDHLGELSGADSGTIYVICRSGSRSLAAAEFLADQGVASVNVAGGTLAWVDTGRTVVTGERPT